MPIKITETKRQSIIYETIGLSSDLHRIRSELNMSPIIIENIRILAKMALDKVDHINKICYDADAI